MAIGKMLFCLCYLLIVLSLLSETFAYGFDSASTCGRTDLRQERAKELPCDFNKQTWCTVAGSAYPWHAVRRFVQENHGLMRRMYGDERHISVLRKELQRNDVDVEDARIRYSDYRNTDGLYDNHISKSSPRSIYSPTLDANINFAGETRPIGRKRNQQSRPKLMKQDEVLLNTKFTFADAIAFSPNDLFTLPQLRKSFISTSSTTPPSTTKGHQEIENIGPEPIQEIFTNDLENNVFNAKLPNYTVYIVEDTFNNEEENISSKNTSIADEETTIQTENTTNTLEESTTDTQSTVEDVSVTEEEMETTTMKFNEINEDRFEIFTDVKDERHPLSEDNSESSQLFQDIDDQETDASEPEPIKLKGVNACPVKEEVVAPFWANNTRGEILALLNLYPFEQYVHWERCTHEHSQMYCRDGCRCEQQYRLHRLLAYDPSNECRGIFSDWFRFPSCCVCKCYDLPAEFLRVTSRSPRVTPQTKTQSQVRRAKIDPEWYRPSLSHVHVDNADAEGLL